MIYTAFSKNAVLILSKIRILFFLNEIMKINDIDTLKFINH